MGDGEGSGEQVSRRARTLERLVVFLFAAFVLVASQLPAVWAWRAHLRGDYPHLTFTGALHTYAGDTATYFSWMEQAREGRLAFTDRFTLDPHPRNYVNVLFGALGWISRLTGLPVVVVYTAARPAAGALLLFLLYVLAARLFARPLERVACFALFVLSSGWEGLATLLGPWVGIEHLSSLVWWSPEVNTVFSLVLFPHFLAALASVVGAILLLMGAWTEGERSPRARVRLAAGAGAVLAALTFFHPFDVIPVVGTALGAPIVFALLRGGTLRRDLRLSAIAVGLCVPAIAYNAWMFRHNPAMRAWDLQNVLPTPNLRGLVTGMGLALPLAVLSGLALRKMERPLLVVWAWLVSVVVAVYLPVRFQRKMLAGVQYPLAALTVAAVFLVIVPLLTRWRGRGRSRAPLWAGVAVLLVLFPTQAATPYYLWRNEWVRLRRHEYPAWLPAPLVAAFRRLAEAPGPEAVVLAAYDTGNFVPPYTGKRCVVGHYALTADAERRGKDVARFYKEGGEDDPWRREALRRWRVRYLVRGPYERALGSFDPSSRPWLRLLHVEGAGGKGETAVYEVVDRI
jgi:hypothetical protein